MEYLQFKNWHKYQQCDRNAPWIKLHTDILQDYKILNLSDSDKLSFFMILIYAGRTGNKIPNDSKFLCSIFCMDDTFNIDKLIDIGILEEWDEKSQSQYIETKNKMIENRKEKDRQNKRKKRRSVSENKMSDSENQMSEHTETETDTETEIKEKNIVKKVCVDDLSVDHIRDWLSEKRMQGKYLHHDEVFILERFKDYCKSKGKRYNDYIAAYRNAFEWDSCQPKQQRAVDPASNAHAKAQSIIARRTAAWQNAGGQESAYDAT